MVIKQRAKWTKMIVLMVFLIQCAQAEEPRGDSQRGDGPGVIVCRGENHGGREEMAGLQA